MNNLPILPKEDVADLLASDLAFEHSVEHNDAVNMQMVLRAHGYKYSYDCAEYAIFFGRDIMNCEPAVV